ncbi:DinB family protein [Pseudonocardia xinjiangensis]|uniref:DinB family protein n=1 Tax=Pseudonocardia xinjiangensis TaxID=75289 RepID=UPI003D906593
MIDDFAKAYLHSDLRDVRETMLWKLDGLTEYDVRRPLTSTGTNLLGLVKHLSNTEARYFGDVFGRPFPERLPWWDEDADFAADKWVTEHESRAEIVDRYRRAWEHTDATIAALAIDAPGHVPWWPRPDVKLFNVMVHVLTETNRHAGHADILREQLDGAVGSAAWNTALQERGTAFWEAHRAKIERAAKAARPAQP